MGDERLPTYDDVVARLLFDPLEGKQETSHPESSSAPEMELSISEPRDPRLRRHVTHDPRSRNYALTDTRVPARAIAWPRLGPILDQGEIGSCTANAGLGLLMTQPFARPGVTYTEQDALALYHDETLIDDREIPGVYPPDDTGSSGLYLMKALQRRGLIKGYRHAFSANAALNALQYGPVAVGTVWLNSMMEPNPRSHVLTVDPRSGEDGGHEYVVDGWNPASGRVRMTNSWSDQWGQHGSAYINYRDFVWLLAQQGDVVQPVMA